MPFRVKRVHHNKRKKKEPNAREQKEGRITDHGAVLQAFLPSINPSASRRRRGAILPDNIHHKDDNPIGRRLKKQQQQLGARPRKVRVPLFSLAVRTLTLPRLMPRYAAMSLASAGLALPEKIFIPPDSADQHHTKQKRRRRRAGGGGGGGGEA